MRSFFMIFPLALVCASCTDKGPSQKLVTDDLRAKPPWCALSYNGDVIELVGDPKILGTAVDQERGVATVKVEVHTRRTSSQFARESEKRECTSTLERKYRKYDTGWQKI